MKLYTHAKRGGLYEIVSGSARLQCSTAPEFEEQLGKAHWTVYRNVDTGAVYVRLTDEFMDGRFAEVPDK